MTLTCLFEPLLSSASRCECVAGKTVLLFWELKRRERKGPVAHNPLKGHAFSDLKPPMRLKAVSPPMAPPWKQADSNCSGNLCSPM